MSAKRQPRRQRPQLSCDTCRRYKRKCDRTSPCAECRFRGKACNFDRAAAIINAARNTPQTPPASIAMSPPDAVQNDTTQEEHANSIAAPSSLVDSWNSPQYSNLSHSLAIQSSLYSVPKTSSDIGQLEAFVCAPNALHHIVTAWQSEDDWYHEVVLDSPFMTAIMQRQAVSLPLVRHYAGVLYTLIALVAQVHPSELEAILIRISSAASMDVGFTSAADLGLCAEQAAKAWLDQAALDSDPLSWRSEFFQTSFLLVKLNKFLGRWVEYRQSLGIDLGRLQRANYHRLSGLTRDKSISHQEISTRHRIFWHYFTLERLSSTFDGIPYTLQARNADMWLVDRAGAVHIHSLCGDQQDEGGYHPTSLPFYVPTVLNLTLSPCGQQMARLAAHAGRFQDQIATLSAASTLSPRQRFERGNKIAACIDEDLISLQNQFKTEIIPPQHHLLVIVGLARVRRDVSILLCNNLQLDPDDAFHWESSTRHFRRRRLDLDRALIRCAVDFSGRVMLSLLGEPFFTVFVCDSVMELVSSVQKQWKDQGVLDRDTILDDLKYALMGRNLLVVISKQSEMQENHNLAAKACQLLVSVIGQVFTVSDATISLIKRLQDKSRVVSVSDLSSLAGFLKSPDTIYPGAGTAEEWLDWIASYPALQRIFDLPVSDINTVQAFE